MTAKVTISLPDELLERLDAEAEALGRSRSFLVREATASYLGRSAEERADEERRARITRAIEGMRHFEDGRRLRDHRPSLETLRELRDNDGFLPSPDAESGDDE